MNRQQERNYAIKCIRTKTLPKDLPRPMLSWQLLVDLFRCRLIAGEPDEQVIAIVDNRALFGEILITFYDLNIDGFSCVESARGELFISALNELQRMRLLNEVQHD